MGKDSHTDRKRVKTKRPRGNDGGKWRDSEKKNKFKRKKEDDTLKDVML